MIGSGEGHQSHRHNVDYNFVSGAGTGDHRQVLRSAGGDEVCPRASNDMLTIN
jgi:hypothetical protein